MSNDISDIKKTVEDTVNDVVKNSQKYLDQVPVQEAGDQVSSFVKKYPIPSIVGGFLAGVIISKIFKRRD